MIFDDRVHPMMVANQDVVLNMDTQNMVPNQDVINNLSFLGTLGSNSHFRISFLSFLILGALQGVSLESEISTLQQLLQTGYEKAQYTKYRRTFIPAMNFFTVCFLAASIISLLRLTLRVYQVGYSVARRRTPALHPMLSTLWNLFCLIVHDFTIIGCYYALVVDGFLVNSTYLVALTTKVASLVVNLLIQLIFEAQGFQATKKKLLAQFKSRDSVNASESEEKPKKKTSTCAYYGQRFFYLFFAFLYFAFVTGSIYVLYRIYTSGAVRSYQLGYNCDSFNLELVSGLDPTQSTVALEPVAKLGDPVPGHTDIQLRPDRMYYQVLADCPFRINLVAPSIVFDNQGNYLSTYNSNNPNIPQNTNISMSLEVALNSSAYDPSVQDLYVRLSFYTPLYVIFNTNGSLSEIKMANQTISCTLDQSPSLGDYKTGFDCSTEKAISYSAQATKIGPRPWVYLKMRANLGYCGYKIFTYVPVQIKGSSCYA